MTVKKSHFPTIIRITCVLAAVMVPTALALRGSWSIATGVVAVQAQDTEMVKNQEIRGETRALSDEIISAIEMIKTRSVASIEQGALQLDLNDGSIIAVAETTRGIFLPAFMKADIQNEVPGISDRDIKFSGLSMFPVKVKTAEGGAALGFAFEQNTRKFIAIVNPLIAFKSVTTWANGKEGDLLRGFVVDGRGHVLIHSEKTFNGADFSGQDLFQRAIEPVFRGQRVAGVGFYSGARASYMRLRSLPYVVVAERVLHTGGMTVPTTTQRLNSILRELRTPLVSMLSIVLLACVGSIFIILSAFGELPDFRSRKVQARQNDAVLNYFTAEQLKRAEEEFAEKTKEIEFIRGSVAKSNPEIDSSSRKPS